MRKNTTACCALCQLSGVGNYTTIDNLKRAINQLKIESEQENKVGDNTEKGQTSVFVIVSPYEYQLSKNLSKLGFKLANTFKRRKGYEKGNLEMYILNLENYE